MDLIENLPGAAPDCAGAPHFESAPLDREVLCPLCRYDLRGLVDPRCPECGFQFNWPELLDPAKRLHPYLFEHHPERNVRSFLRTAWGSLFPKRFWTTLHPAQPSAPRRLIFYFATASLWILVILAVQLGRTCIDAARDMRMNRSWTLNRINAALTNQVPDASWSNYVREGIQNHGSLQRFLDEIAPLPNLQNIWDHWFLWRRSGRDVLETGLILASGFLFWPLFTFSSLMVFRWSMKRARVQAIHVFRSVVYCSDVLVFAVAPFAAAVAVYPAPPGSVIEWQGVALLLSTGGAAVFGYRLIRAYSDYLRFDRPMATVLASQAIVFLLVLIGYCVYLGTWWVPY